MNEKTFNTRIVHKHDTEANWTKAINFIPMQGEIIVYDIDENHDYERIKIGDGVNNINDLFFITDNLSFEDVKGLQEAINAAADSKFYVVTFDQGSDGEYHGDLTFAEIREKFEAGGNMVARIDGTDYIPLLSAAPH